MQDKQIIITAALPYINNVPHMGHIVGSHLPADIFYRYCKMKGYDAIFIGGSDEHGTPSAVAARDMGMDTQAFVDSVQKVHKEVYEKLSIDYLNYSRTSGPVHHKYVTEFFNKINDSGFIHKETISQYYCEKDNMFLPDRFLVGTCPKCGYEQANADQCEKCTSVLTATELINPRCKMCDCTPVMKDTEHLYITMEKVHDKLEAWVDSKKDIWRKHVYGEAKKWLEEGVRNRSITRDMKWGVKVPVEGYEDKVFYVWFDAPIGYASFSLELGQELFDKFWKGENTQMYHFLGKDNIPFHTIFWPAMLLAHGDLVMPYNVVGYNYLNFEGTKFSKSQGIGVFCYNLLDENIDIDIDVLRSYLTTVIPETKDSDFKWEDFRTITNKELSAKIGNFFNRCLNIVWKNFDGCLDYELNENDLNDDDKAILEVIANTPAQISKLMENVEIRDAYKAVLQFASEGNVYIDKCAPWKMIKQGDMESAKKVLYIAMSICRSIAIMATPILPNSMQKFYSEQLNLEGDIYSTDMWDKAAEIVIPKEHKINKPSPLFAMIDDDKLEELKTALSKPYSLEDIVKHG